MLRVSVWAEAGMLAKGASAALLSWRRFSREDTRRFCQVEGGQIKRDDKSKRVL